MLYYFARQILTGETAPFDIYVASDCTIPGIQAVRSSLDGGKPYEVPDFRKKRERDKYRNDDFDQPRFDAGKGCFPKSADKALTGKFTTMMRDLVQMTTAYRSYTDWAKFAGEAKEPQRILDMADALIASHPNIVSTIHDAQELAAKYPKSDGARLINEMLADIEPGTVTAPGYLKRLKKERIALEKRMAKR